MKVLTSVLAVLALTTPFAAQKLAVEFEQPFFNPTTLRLKIHDATGNGFQVFSPCADVAIFLDTKTGPQLPFVPSCGPGFTAVPSYGTLLWDWQALDPAGNPWPATDYWFRIRANDPTNGTPIEEWFCHRWMNAGPSLYLGQVNVGQTSTINLSNGPANGLYRVVLSRTQNNPFSLFGIDWCVSLDGTLLASVNNSGTFFSNGIGLFDANGDATAGLVVPPLAMLEYQGFAVQAVTVDLMGTGAYDSTNPVTRRILP